MNKLIKFSAIYALALSRNIYNFKIGAFLDFSKSQDGRRHHAAI
jgi:hypothetical protein